ncbi:MAG: hypothetical protein EBW57_02285, partial [Candidatus Fonsibacter ubiquis]|nr:hypothetical protein [Candidatus Fonsibacter ubiquis]
VKIGFETNGNVEDCDIVMAASNKYRQGQDHISAFVQEMVRKKEGKRIKRTGVHFMVGHVVEDVKWRGRDDYGYITFPKYRIYSSAIVGGQLPQALGVASALKRMGRKDNVWCFVGDMTSETGVAQTVFQYAWNWDLPINFIIEG